MTRLHSLCCKRIVFDNFASVIKIDEDNENKKFFGFIDEALSMHSRHPESVGIWNVKPKLLIL